MRIGNITILKLYEDIFYDGSQMQQHWALKNFGIIGDSIVIFRGGMNVKKEEMIDQLDMLKGHEIRGDYLLHVIVEHFDVQPPNIEIAYLRQRLLVGIFQEYLRKYNIERRFGDLYYKGRKLSVSVASVSNVSMKIHLGINIKCTGTPIEVSCLEEFYDGNPIDMARDVCIRYAEEIERIKRDIFKTKILR